MTGQFFFTLLNPLFAFGFAAIFGLMWRRWPRQTYLVPLTCAFLCSGLSFVGQDFLVPWHEQTGRLLANAMFLASIALVCSSALQRVGIAAPVRLFAAICLVGALPFLWYLYVDPALVPRIVVVAAIVAVLALVTFALMLAARPATLVARALAICVFLGFVAAVARPVLVLAGLLDVNAAGDFQDSDYWATVQAFSPILTLVIALVFLLAVAVDIFNQLRSDANHDYLTGLLNRRGFETAAAASLANTALGRHPALLLADIDDFKKINDGFGHKVGDDAITGVARVLAEQGQAAVTARIGGEEFALFFPHATRRQLQERVEAIQFGLSDASIPGLPVSYTPTLSIGVHSAESHETLAEMMTRADKALYRAKRDGKNRAVFTPLPPHSYTTPIRAARA